MATTNLDGRPSDGKRSKPSGYPPWLLAAVAGSGLLVGGLVYAIALPLIGSDPTEAIAVGAESESAEDERPSLGLPSEPASSATDERASETRIRSTVTTPTTIAAEGKVPESAAMISDGVLHLSGAVQSEDARIAIVELATTVMGEGNVVDEYVIDPRAGDPSRGKIVIEDTVLFEFASAKIVPGFTELLDKATVLMTIRPATKLTVVGHTDNIGPDDYNLALSRTRADTAAKYLISSGIAEERIETRAAGESEPRSTNNTEEGRRSNRRIEFLLENLL